MYKPHLAIQHEEEIAALRAIHPSALTGGISAPLVGGGLAPLSVMPHPVATDRAVNQSLVKITPHSLQRIYQHQVTKKKIFVNSCILGVAEGKIRLRTICVTYRRSFYRTDRPVPLSFGSGSLFFNSNLCSGPSGSVRQRFGSGSFHQSLKNDVNALSYK